MKFTAIAAIVALQAANAVALAAPHTLNLLDPPQAWSGSVRNQTRLEIVPSSEVPLAAELQAAGKGEDFPHLHRAFSTAQDWRSYPTLRVRLRLTTEDPNVSGKPLNFVLYDANTRIETLPGAPQIQQNCRLWAAANQWTEVDLDLREFQRSAITALELYLYRNPPEAAHRCRMEIARMELIGPDSGAVLFDGEAYAAKPALEAGISAQRIETRDGLAMKLTSTGAIESIELDGKAIGGGTGGLSGWMLRDATKQDAPQRRLEGLDFTPGCTGRDGYLELTGAVHNRSGKDHLITAYIALPLSEDGWRWGGSISREETPALQSGFELSQAKYPLSALTLGERGGLSLAVRMDEPARYRLTYNPAQRLYYAAFDLAVTAEKPDASFRAILYRHDPAWGFRSALQRYYDFFPGFFTKNVRRDGGWAVWQKSPPGADFLAEGYAFSWGPNASAEIMEGNRANGVLSLPYIEPEYWQMSLGDQDSASESAAMDRLRRLASGDAEEWERFAKLRYTATDSSGHHRPADTGPRAFYRQLAHATLNSLAAAADGSFRAQVGRRDWIGDSGVGAMFPCNLDPDIPEGKGWFNTQVAIRSMLADQEKATGSRMDGLSLDCFLGSTEDFRRDHFRYLDGPLTWFRTPAGLRPGIAAEWGSVEWIRDLKRQPWWDKRVLMANLGDTAGGSRLTFAAPYLDIFGIEHSWVPDADYLRSMARDKTITDLPYSPREPWVPAFMQLHCIFPGEGHDRALMKNYYPSLQALAREGWRPVTGARSRSADVRLERYGRYLVAHNRLDQPVETTLEISAPEKASRALSLTAKETRVIDLQAATGD